MKNFSLLFLIVLSGCQMLSPDSIQVPEYPDYETVMLNQSDALRNHDAKKRVWLDGKSETKVLKMDSTKWAKELSFLKEINPNQSEYIGAFQKSGDEFNQTLTLAAGESGSLKKTSFSKSDIGYEKISATFHEDKDVYIHHREIELNFENGLISSLQINGYQKMMFKDTVRFRISILLN